MSTVLEEQRSVVRFLSADGLYAMGVHKEIFLIYGWKCLSRKAVRNSVEKFSQGRSKIADDARRGRSVEVATESTTIKRLLCCGFRRFGKAMRQVHRSWRIYREINVFPRFEYHMF
jgi:hypothetical protein